MGQRVTRLFLLCSMALLSGCAHRESQASRDHLNCIYTERYEHHMTAKQAEDWCAR